MNTPYQICVRCVMDTTDPHISFNDNGECNHCTEFIDVRSKYQYNPEKSEHEFQQRISTIKKDGAGKEYDVVLGLSGGIDSSYAAYICKQNGLRVLAVHLDNGWNSEEAVQNIKNIARKLGIDYESFVLDWNEFKDLQLAFLKAGVPEAETPTDIAIPAVLHKTAAKYGIKHIVSGGNFATEGILPKHWHYNAKDMRYFNSIYKQFGTRSLKTFPTFGFKKEMYYKLVKKINFFYVLNTVPYNKEDAMAFLEKELGWKYYGGKHYESKYTGFIQSYYLYEKFGIDYRRATLATQICNKEISRELALELLQSKSYSDEKVEQEKAYIAKKLGISREEFDRILLQPAKWYTDYPNDEKRLKFIYDTYRKLFKKEKLGSF